MEFLRRLYNKLGRYLGEYDRSKYPLYNLNLNILEKQKRVAFVYSNAYLFSVYNIQEAKHSNSISFFTKLYYFQKNNYVIDLYECNPNSPDIVAQDPHYDIVFGFGKLYEKLCKLNPSAIKILYVSENAPWIVERKFQERLEYYQERHNHSVYTVARNGYYTKEMFELSDFGIVGNGPYNIEEMKRFLPFIYPIKISAIFNDKFIFQKKNHTVTRKRFLWFGSSGSIHKGLDILIDVFKELPDLDLDIYGALPVEIKEFNLPPNVHNCGFVTVSSDDFIDNVVNKHSFVISLSCSEALQSSVSTCMGHGIIPIVTPETGFDDIENAIICDDFRVNEVKRVIHEASIIEPSLLQEKSFKIYAYTRKEFSMESVEQHFTEIMDSILKNI